MIVVLLALFACTSDGPVKEDSNDSASPHDSPVDRDSGQPNSGDTSEPADDSGSPEPECEAPSLRLIAEVSGLDLHPSSVPPLPHVLGSCGWGLAVIDVNQDGLPDLVPAGAWAPTYALINDGDTFYPDPSVTFDGEPLPMSNGLTTGDVDGDGRPDLIALRTTGSADRVYINQGGGSFASSDLPDSELESQGASLFDADNDGDLDLFIARHVDNEEMSLSDLEAGIFLADRNGFYLNDGGTFSAADVPGNPLAASFQGVPFDADGDGDLDLFIVNDFGVFIHPSELMLNNAGEFTVAEDCQCDGAKFGMGAAVADVDGNGIPDLHVTNFGTPDLLLGMGLGQYYESAAASGVIVGPERVTGWGTSFVDANMDGDPDLVSAFGPVVVGMEGDWSDLVTHDVVAGIDDMPSQPSALWMNAEGSFTEFSSMVGFDTPGVTRSVVVADFNRDGLPDLATSGLYPNRFQVVRVYVSEGGCGPGVVVDFPEMAAADLGATVKWSVNGTERTAWMVPGTTFSSSGSTLHLGLAGHASADWVRIIPVNGDPVEHVNVPAGTTLTQRSYQ